MFVDLSKHQPRLFPRSSQRGRKHPLTNIGWRIYRLNTRNPPLKTLLMADTEAINDPRIKDKNCPPAFEVVGRIGRPSKHVNPSFLTFHKPKNTLLKSSSSAGWDGKQQNLFFDLSRTIGQTLKQRKEELKWMNAQWSLFLNVWNLFYNHPED